MKQSNSKPNYNTTSQNTFDTSLLNKDLVRRFIDQIEKRFMGRIAYNNKERFTLEELKDILGLKARQNVLVLRKQYEASLKGGEK